VLTEHGCPIAPSTFYDNLTRVPSRRAVRDEEMKAVITAERRNKFVARLGARKLWLHLRRKGHDVARCTIERLMREMGIHGVRRGRYVVTTVADPAALRPADLVDRDFTTTAPNQLWVADFTYVPTWSGFVYVAFIIDAYSRRFIGWRCATRMTTDLVLDALEHALWTRARDGISDLGGLIHHNDAGSQGGFNWSSQHLDHGGGRWSDNVRRCRGRRERVGSGPRIGRCGHRCVRRAGQCRRVRCRGSSGG
jgi:putative transposase